jgi:hypothetical protein
MKYYAGIGSQVHEDMLQFYEDSGRYVAQAKSDGIYIAVVDNVFYSRTGTVRTPDMPKLPIGHFHLIGELGIGTETAVGRRKELGHDFMDVFDIWLPMLELRFRRPYLERYLESLPEEHRKHYRLVKQVDTGFKEFYDKEVEGVVLKPKDSMMNFTGKLKEWIKVKKLCHVDAIVMGYTISKAASHAGQLEAFQLGVYRDGGMEMITSIGSLTKELRKDGLINYFEKYRGRVMEIECYTVFKSGMLRHPSMVRWRDDKSALDCTWEELMKLRR